MINRSSNIFYVYLLILGLSACVSNYSKQNLSVSQLPKAYIKSTDSALVDLQSWRVVFTDTLLIQHIDTVLKNNLDIKIALQRIEQAQAQVLLARGKQLPFIAAQAGAGLTKYGKYTQEAVGNYDVQFSQNISKDEIIPRHLPDFGLGFQSSWELDVWGRLNNAKKSAYYKVLASNEGKNMLLSNLVALVADTYYELLALDYELDIVRQTIVLQNNQLNIIRLEKETGRANELAVQQFEAQVLNYKTLEYEILQKIVENENYLNFLSGTYTKDIKRNKSLYITTLPVNVAVGLPSSLLDNRPDIREASFQVLAANVSLVAAKKAFYPRLNISGKAGIQSFNPNFVFSPQSFAYSVLGGLVAPLVNMSAIRTDLKVSKAQQIEAVVTYQKAILNGYLEVNNQVSNIKNLESQYELKNKEVALLNKAIETVSELYLRGRASYLEILYTRKTALQSSLELIEIKKRQFDASIAIYKALGGGWK
jgi:outer membrane protein, multidrug efflux system